MHREDIAAIRKLAKDWDIAWERTDTDALLSLYTSDPVLMPQDQPVVIGKDAIRTLYQALFKDYRIKGEGKVVEIDVSGDLGYIWNSYTMTAILKNGREQIAVEGKSVFIVRRQNDNSWKISRLIDNSDRQPITSKLG